MGRPSLISSLASLFLLVACTPESDPCRVGHVCTIMGSGELGFNGDGLAALETRLASPTSVSVSPDGQIAVTDYSNMLIRVLQDDETVGRIAGNGIHAYSEIGADALATPLENPIDSKWGPDGRLYILPQHEGRLIAINDDGTVDRIAGTGEIGDSGDGGPALDATMGFGGGFDFGSDGSIYISDNTFSRIRQVQPDGRIRTILGIGEGGIGPTGYGPDTPIRFPERIRVDNDNNRLLVADTMNHRLLAVDLDSLATHSLAGTGEPGLAGEGELAEMSQLHAPVGVEVDHRGGVLVADMENMVIRQINSDGLLFTIAGSEAWDAEFLDSAPALEFPMSRPTGLAWTLEGDLVVAERSGHRVLKITGLADEL